MKPWELPSVIAAVAAAPPLEQLQIEQLRPVFADAITLNGIAPAVAA